VPVLGHADGVCHTYMDKDADVAKAIRVIVDAKTDYPAACNALETLLVHKDWVGTQTLSDVINALKDAGVRHLQPRERAYGSTVVFSHSWASPHCWQPLID